MRRIICILVIFLFIGVMAFSQSPNWSWAKSAGGTDHDMGYSVATDASGNIFTTGFFWSDTITFGTTTFINSGSFAYSGDIFIVKYDAGGNVLWAKSAGGTSDDAGQSISIDGSGNVLVTGFFRSDTLNFGTTTLINSNAGFKDIFIVKYDTNGNVIWAKSEGGYDDDVGQSVATDAAGNVFITGFFKSPVITIGTDTLINADVSFYDVFIVKYDAGGNVLWAKSADSNSNDEGQSISIDAGGYIYMTGYFVSFTITFGTDTLINTHPGWSDVFIVKYDAGGNVLWAKNEGGTSSEDGKSVTTDAGGNVLMTGMFYSPSITFGTTTLTNAGAEDIYIVKYDPTGNVLWAKSAGGTLTDISNSVATDVSGNVFITGYFGSPSITFGSTTLNNAGTHDLFILQYDSGGNPQWAKSAGGTFADLGNSVATDAGGNVFISGFFQSPTITFGTDTLINVGNTTNKADFFIAKLDATTGIEEVSGQYSVSICPNPFSSRTTLTFSHQQHNTGLKLFNLMGQEIETIVFSEKQLTLEKGNLKEGIYFIKITDEKKKMLLNRKIIIE